MVALQTGKLVKGQPADHHKTVTARDRQIGQAIAIDHLAAHLVIAGHDGAAVQFQRNLAMARHGMAWHGKDIGAEIRPAQRDARRGDMRFTQDQHIARAHLRAASSRISSLKTSSAASAALAATAPGRGRNLAQIEAKEQAPRRPIGHDLRMRGSNPHPMIGSQFIRRRPQYRLRLRTSITDLGPSRGFDRET